MDKLRPDTVLRPGTLLQHFTGDRYRVIAVGRTVHGDGPAETVQEMAITYRGLYTSRRYGRGAVWTRTYDNMFEEFNTQDGKQRRFAIVGQPGPIRTALAWFFKKIF